MIHCRQTGKISVQSGARVRIRRVRKRWISRTWLPFMIGNGGAPRTHRRRMAARVEHRDRFDGGGLMVSSPFRGMAILLGILSTLAFAAAAPFCWTKDESGRQGLLRSLEKTIARQERLVAAFWAGTAISVAALATVLLGASRLLGVAESQPPDVWIALAAAALYGLCGLALCGFRAWRAQAELRRLTDICRHLSRPADE